MPDELAAALAALRNLTHDELTDLIDLLDFHAGVKGVFARRKGKTPLDKLPTSEALAVAWKLPPDQRQIVAATAATIRAALAPRERRKVDPETGDPLAQGTLQTKSITKAKFDLDTGEIIYVTYGPYLYLRRWATGGGSDRRFKRLKNHYIGRTDLALAFDLTEPGSSERRELEQRIIAAWDAGTLADFHVDS